jgi:hypothetical protein
MEQRFHCFAEWNGTRQKLVLTSLRKINPLHDYRILHAELEFLKSLLGLGTEEEEGYRTGPPGYIGWRNSFLGIDSGAPYTFKNTGSGRKSLWSPPYNHCINIHKRDRFGSPHMLTSIFMEEKHVDLCPKLGTHPSNCLELCPFCCPDVHCKC